ncbi:MAG: aminotransferase class V-fold PLP-dependent enzyme [Planctomycetaceae bacterium]
MTSIGSDSDRLVPPDWPVSDDAIRSVFAAMLRDGSWGRYHGPHCEHLRNALAEYHSVDHVILCSSGTSAVELALRAARVQPGDEVIMAAYDYKANFANVLILGAVPVLVDTLPGLPVLDPAQIPAAITERTRAVIASHLHGSFGCLNEIRKFADASGIVVIEDACQAVGGILDGRPAGSLGDLGILSFGGSKLLTAGRGGAVLTNDATLAQRIRLYTQRGNDAYPLSEMQAAILQPQLQQLPERTDIRLSNVRRLLNGLSGCAGLQPALTTNAFEITDQTPAFYKLAFQFCGLLDGNSTRESLAARLRSRGVAMDAAFFALHRIHSRSRFRAIGNLSNADELHDRLMVLHHPVLLGGAEEMERLTTVISDVIGNFDAEF